jgi:Tfp pilus assembly protein PilO
MLFALTLTPEWGIIIVLAVTVTVFAVAWWFRRDDKLEQRRKDAIEVIGLLKKYGWDQTAEVVTCYVSEDWTGVYNEIKALLKQLRDPDQARALITNAILRGLSEVMNDEAAAAKVRKIVGPAPAPPDPTAPVA